jgi:hypothetical protein
MNTTISEPNSPDGGKTDWLEVVRQNVASVRFGSVQITIHDGRVTQVESIEKTRFVTSRDEAGDRKSS